MTGLPGVFDAFTAAMVGALGAGVVFDGPPVAYVGSRGVALGATRDSESVPWLAPPSDLGGEGGEAFSIPCLAWSGSGDTVFKPHRDAVAAFLVVAEQVVSADRRFGGVVDTAWITGGTWLQEQTGSGALVTCEFRIDCTRF